MSIFFTADTHFGHANIIRYCDRPFESKQEHDETLIANWNSMVQKGDTVYHLGDFGFGSPKWLNERIAGKLHGRIILIKGNHDQGVIREPLSSRFETIKDVHLITTQKKGKKVKIFLSHYAHLSWPFSNHGSYHLFGHSHGNLLGVGRSCDVGVDCWNFRPISLDQIIDHLDEKFETIVNRKNDEEI